MVTAGTMRIGGYPVRQVTLHLGATSLQLFVVDRLEDYVDGEALLRDAEAPEPPYWAHVWPGARALARLLASEVECRGRRLVDIGCGLGVAGLAAARRGADVTLIDTTYDALRFVHANAALNGCAVHVVQMDVKHPGLRGRFDYCCAADVTYDPALQQAVAAFLAAHLARGGRAWCAESVRTFDVGFQRACTQHGLHVRTRDLTEPDDGRSTRVRLTEVAWGEQ